MKLLRVGDLGHEKVAALDANNIMRDLSSHIEDLNPETINFNNLKKLEEKNGFDEATKHSKFFRSGTSNQWKDVLTNAQVKLIEKNLKSLMKYFNYI